MPIGIPTTCLNNLAPNRIKMLHHMHDIIYEGHPIKNETFSIAQ